MTDEDRQVPWFAMPKGFPQTQKASDVRGEVGPLWSFEVYGRHAFMFNLAALANRGGTFTTTLRSFCERAYAWAPPKPGPDASDEVRDVYEAWHSKESAFWVADAGCGFVEVDLGALLTGAKVEVRLVDYTETNRPRASADAKRRAKDAERKRRTRAAKKDAVTSMSAPVRNVRSLQEKTVQDSKREDLKGQSQYGTAPPAPTRIHARPTPTDLQVLDSETEHQLDRLLAVLTDRDEGTRGVLVGLARKGLGAPDFADAREAVQVCKPSRSVSGYAVKTLQERLGGVA